MAGLEMRQPAPADRSVLTPDVSIVVPIYNEAATLADLCAAIDAALADRSHEILLVDDGSTDHSWEVITRLGDANTGIRGLRLRRNFGKATALGTGFAEARGAYIVTIDADLQDDPTEIPRLLAALTPSVDVVSGWKKRRRDPWNKRFPSKIFNCVVRATSDVRIHDFNCGFKAYRAEVAKSLRLYGELHRYIPMLCAAEGFRVTELEVVHHERQSGHSKYGWKRYLRGGLDLFTVLMLTRYLQRPAHLFGGLALLIGTAGLGILTYLSIGWFLGHKGIGTRPLFFFGILGTLLSAQLLSIGLIAELVLYHARRDKSPPRQIAERAGGE